MPRSIVMYRLLHRGQGCAQRSACGANKQCHIYSRRAAINAQQDLRYLVRPRTGWPLRRRQCIHGSRPAYHGCSAPSRCKEQGGLWGLPRPGGRRQLLYIFSRPTANQKVIIRRPRRSGPCGWRARDTSMGRPGGRKISASVQPLVRHILPPDPATYYVPDADAQTVLARTYVRSSWQPRERCCNDEMGTVSGVERLGAIRGELMSASCAVLGATPHLADRSSQRGRTREKKKKPGGFVGQRLAIQVWGRNEAEDGNSGHVDLGGRVFMHTCWS